MQRVLRMADIHGGAAQRLIDESNRRALESIWYARARAGVRVPRIVQYPTPRGYPLTQVEAPITYPTPVMRARYLLDL